MEPRVREEKEGAGEYAEVETDGGLDREDIVFMSESIALGSDMKDRQ